jgi:ribosome-associated heat shock protein Hsp15
MGTSRAGSSQADRVRIDRWLWAARFFKTRTLAGEAVDGGKVHVNGRRVKASRGLKPGDRVEIRRGHEEFEVVVVALSEQRGPATAAQALFEETPASATRRSVLGEQRRTLAAAVPRPGSRPDTKARRALARMKRGY